MVRRRRAARDRSALVAGKATRRRHAADGRAPPGRRAARPAGPRRDSTGHPGPRATARVPRRPAGPERAPIARRVRGPRARRVAIVRVPPRTAVRAAGANAPPAPGVRGLRVNARGPRWSVARVPGANAPPARGRRVLPATARDPQPTVDHAVGSSARLARGLHDRRPRIARVAASTAGRVRRVSDHAPAAPAPRVGSCLGRVGTVRECATIARRARRRGAHPARRAPIATRARRTP